MTSLFTTELEPFLYISGPYTIDEFSAYEYIGCKYLVVGMSSAGTVEVNEFMVIHDHTAAQLSNIITVSNKVPNVLTINAAYLRDHVRVSINGTVSLKIQVYKTLLKKL